MQANQYKQMIGRAGRAGMISSTGESILIFQSIDMKKVCALIRAPSKKCESSFECNDSKAIRVLVLSLIALNLTHSGQEILNFFKQTLFYIQQKKIIEENVKKANCILSESSDVPQEFNLISNALQYLLKNKLITVKKNAADYDVNDLEKENDLNMFFFTSQLEVTKLGTAAIKGNIDLDYVHQLYDDLEIGLKSIVLSNSLHLLFLCTPYDLVNSLTGVDFDTYCRKVKINYFEFHPEAKF
jgi:POLQ-like helicase